MSTTPVTIRLATREDLDVILHADLELYDNPVRADRTIEFLTDPRHHLALAFAGDTIVGTASAIHYIHPDKEPTLFILEVAVLSAFQGRGIGRGLVTCLLEHGRAIGCVDAWIATEPDNIAARRAYVAAGGIEAADPFVLIEYDLRITPVQDPHTTDTESGVKLSSPDARAQDSQGPVPGAACTGSSPVSL